MHNIPESDFQHRPPYKPLHPSKLRRKHFKVVVIPAPKRGAKAKGAGSARMAFGQGLAKDGHGDRGIVRGDRLFTSEESIWLRREPASEAEKRTQAINAATANGK